VKERTDWNLSIVSVDILSASVVLISILVIMYLAAAKKFPNGSLKEILKKSMFNGLLLTVKNVLVAQNLLKRMEDVCTWLAELNMVVVDLNSVGYAEEHGKITDLKLEDTTLVTDMILLMLKKLDEQNEQFKLELDEYAHYFSRFNSHLETLKLDEESPAFAQAKCDAIISKFEVRAQDTQYILDANQQIRHNRRILSNSYIYGYYLDKDNEAEKYLFEHLQTDLEANNERLSKLYERDLVSISDKEEFIEWKEDVTNFTRVTAQFLDKFITGVMRGLNKTNFSN